MVAFTGVVVYYIEYNLYAGPVKGLCHFFEFTHLLSGDPELEYLLSDAKKPIVLYPK